MTITVFQFKAGSEGLANKNMSTNGQQGQRLGTW